MATKVLTFRLPKGWSEYLGRIASTYHFGSPSELLRLALTECVYNSMMGKWKVKGEITPPTVIIGCRLPGHIHDIITDRILFNRNKLICN